MQAETKESFKKGAGLTMADIAKVAGVSSITVSRALRDSPLVAPATRATIRKVANEMGYRINVNARNLRMRRSYLVAVVVEMAPMKGRPMSDPYPLELLGGITQELTTAGYSVVLTSMQLMQAAAMPGPDGLILLGQGALGEAALALERFGSPLVVWGAPDRDSCCIVVGSDNRKGGMSVAERFLEQGRRRFIFLGDVNHAEVRERCVGFMDAAEREGTLVHAISPKAFTYEAGFDSISAALGNPGGGYDGVFAASDLLAMGAVDALLEGNLSVPEDVSVVGYDNTPGAANFSPPLSSVHQRLHEGGVLLARKILDLIRGEAVASEMLPAMLIPRQT